MARSSYIYIVLDSWGVVDAAFTVKHEMESYLTKSFAPARYSVLRVRDGGMGDNTVLVELQAEKKL